MAGMNEWYDPCWFIGEELRMTTITALIASFPGLVPTMLGWLCGALVIVGVFLFNRSRMRDHSRE